MSNLLSLLILTNILRFSIENSAKFCYTLPIYLYVHCILRSYVILNNCSVLIICRRLCSEHTKLSTGCTRLNGTENLIKQLFKLIRASKKADV